MVRNQISDRLLLKTYFNTKEMIIVIAILLVAATAYRFHCRFNAEFHRQRMITWPRVPAIFDPKEPILLEPYVGSEKKWFTRLLKPYRFYFNGELREGNHLIPDKVKLKEYDQWEVGRRLNRRRDGLTVRCNPEAPEENALLVPHQKLSWPNLLGYVFYGVVLPFALIQVGLYWYQAPAEWWEVITFNLKPR